MSCCLYVKPNHLYQVDNILEELCKFGLLRREPIIAIGGGVVLDIAGFAASMYRRGMCAPTAPIYFGECEHQNICVPDKCQNCEKNTKLRNT